MPEPYAVHFSLPEAMTVRAAVYSVRGARVRVLARDERFGSGLNRLTWDGRTERGAIAASGVYFVRIETRVGTRIARAVLLK